MRIKAGIKANRLVTGTGLLFLFLSLGHIPVDIFPHAFDKNAPVHLLVLILISILFSIYIIINHHKLFISGKAVFLVVFLATVLLISSLNSPDLYGSLIGDAGRYTGAASLLALIIVAIFHAQLKVSM